MRVSGSNEVVVSSREGIAAALEDFSRFVQEAVLIEGRTFRLGLNFFADENMNPDYDF